MNIENTLKNKIVDLNQAVKAIISRGRKIPGMPAGALDRWSATCDSIHSQIEEDMLRVAVVGAIKSGKSTCINSLFRGDYLKRGAGVITSIVTRARQGDSLCATLHFKSWDEVNRDMNQALVLFPNFENDAASNGFDIRRGQDRDRLRSALDALGADQWFTRSTRNPNGVLLSSYLEGYDTVETIVCAEEITHRFPGDRFFEHQAFVGRDALAVYLKDVELSIDSGSLGRNIEIADCQGSDSSNPLHLAMIQDYLLLTHMIVYVISSRTGLREADIRFLNMIRNMGILENILFVVNCDISEHDSLDNLTSVVSSSAREIAVIKPEAELFTLSALYSLFKYRRDSLPQKDRQRLDHWEGDAAITDFLTAEAARFENVLGAKLEHERLSLLLINHLERLDIIASGVAQYIGANRDILSRDASGARTVIDRIVGHQKKLDQIKSGLRSTLDGTVEKLKMKIRADSDHFFDPHSGQAIGSIGEFIRTYSAPLPQDEARLDAAGFSNNLYLMYQDFKQALDGFMAEKVNPEVIRFVRQMEGKIIEDVAAIADPYAAIVQQALEDYATTLAGEGIAAPETSRRKIPPPDMASIKSGMALSLPPASDSMRYSARVKTEATVRFGIYSLFKFVKKVFKRPIPNPREEQTLALRDGLQQIKRETEQSVSFHFKNFRENLKFAYFFKFAEAVADYFFEALIDRFQTHSADLLQMVDAANQKQADKDQTCRTLEVLGEEALVLTERVRAIKSTVENGIG